MQNGVTENNDKISTLISKNLEGAGKAGTYQVERLDCEKGFSLIESKMTTKRTCSEFCQYEGQEKIVVIAFALEGHSGFYDSRGKALLFNAGSTTVSLFQAGQGQRIYSANECVHQLRLVLTESALRQFIGEERSHRLLGAALAPNERFRQLACHRNLQSEHLRYFKNQTIEQRDGLRQRITAFSLLAEQLDVLESSFKQNERLSPRDLANLAYIEEYIRKNLDKPINNAYLCLKFALSDYKLKAYFKRAHGVSPGHFILSMRMYRAHELLKAGYRVSETAYKVGYQHPSNFTAAFVRFYGYSPKLMVNM